MPLAFSPPSLRFAYFKHPRILPLHDRLSLFRFNLSSRPFSLSHTPRAHAQTESSRQTNYRYISGYTPHLHISYRTGIVEYNTKCWSKQKGQSSITPIAPRRPMSSGTEEIISNRNVMEPTLQNYNRAYNRKRTRAPAHSIKWPSQYLGLYGRLND